MSGITRCILRYGVIGALALGGVTLLVGPDRMAAGLSQVRVKAQNVVDSCAAGEAANVVLPFRDGTVVDRPESPELAGPLDFRIAGAGQRIEAERG